MLSMILNLWWWRWCWFQVMASSVAGLSQSDLVTLIAGLLGVNSSFVFDVVMSAAVPGPGDDAGARRLSFVELSFRMSSQAGLSTGEIQASLSGLGVQGSMAVSRTTGIRAMCACACACVCVCVCVNV
jgi:hypothetical protein